MDKFNKYAIPIGLAVVILALGWVIFGGGAEQPVARGTYNVPVYVEQGGSKMVVESGGAIEIQAGGSLMVTPGATLSIGGADADNLVVSAPTAIGTATPAAVINSLGVSNLLEVRDAATPVFTINNGGAVVGAGAGTYAGGQTINNWAKVAAPTAVATATPAMVVDSLGVSTILEVRDAATPVFTVNNGGTVTGQVLRYSTAGSQLVCGTDTITETADVTHGLTTPAFAVCSLAQDPTGDAQSCSTSISGSTVTIKVWQSAATPAANTAGADVNWCVVGAP